MRGLDTAHPGFSWAQFVEYIPGLADGERKSLRQVLRFGGTTLAAALQELGLPEQPADAMQLRAAEAIWAKVFADSNPALAWQELDKVPAPVFELGLDRLYLIALAKQANGPTIRAWALGLGNVELQAVAAEKLAAMKLLGLEQATFSRLTAHSVEEALASLPERDQNKVATVIVVAALLGIVEPLTGSGPEQPADIEPEAAVALPAVDDDPAHVPTQPWWERTQTVTAYDMLGGSSNDSRRELTSLYQRALKQLDEARLSPRESSRNRRLLVTAFAIATQDDMAASYMQIQREGMRGTRAVAEAQARADQGLLTDALALTRKGDFGGAYPLLLRVRETSPDNADSAAVLGLLTVSGHPAIEFDPVRGLEFIQAAADLDNQRATYKYWEGVVLEWLQQPENARTAYTACLSIDPEHPAARHRLDQLGA